MKQEYLLESSTFHNPILDVKDETKRNKILEVTKPFRLTKQTVDKIRSTFLKEINLGLSEPSKAGSKECSLHMINTFITCLPNGQEEGDFLSLDLGSTNFRVCLSQLKKNEEGQFNVKYYDIPDKLRFGKAAELFDHIADCIGHFVESYPQLKGKQVPLGFTFSYPMKQESINVGRLVTWTKSYDIKDAIGENAAKLLQDALDRKAINIKVAAILNDSSGTLVKGIYLDQDCSIGLIMGSGFNCCYLEKIANVPHFPKTGPTSVDRVLINLECGGFGDNGCIDLAKAPVDFEVDSESLFKGSFSFEKLFSGVFLGDLIRRIMLDLARKGLLFDGKVSDGLTKKDSFLASDVSKIEADEKNEAKVREIIMKNLGYPQVSEDDVAVVKYLCALLSVRAAIFIASLLASLIERIDRETVKIAIDGSLYKHHPKIKTLMTDFIQELVPGRKFDHFLAEDGSGKGAGLVVAALHRNIKPSL